MLGGKELFWIIFDKARPDSWQNWMIKVEAMQKVDKFKKHLINVETFELLMVKTMKKVSQKYLHKEHFIKVIT